MTYMYMYVHVYVYIYVYVHTYVYVNDIYVYVYVTRRLVMWHDSFTCHMTHSLSHLICPIAIHICIYTYIQYVSFVLQIGLFCVLYRALLNVNKARSFFLRILSANTRGKKKEKKTSPRSTVIHKNHWVTWYGVAMIRRLLNITGLFCKRGLWKRRYTAKETYNFKEPHNRSHPIYAHDTHSLRFIYYTTL